MSINIDELTKKLEEIKILLEKVDFSDNIDVKTKFNYFCTFCESRIKSPYVVFLTEDIFNNNKILLDNTRINLENYKNYKQSNDISALNNIIIELNKNIYKIVSSLNNIPFVGKGETQNSLNKIVSDFVQKASDLSKNISEYKNNFESDISKYKKEFDSNKTEFTNSVKLLEKNIEDKKTEVDTLKNNLSSQFLDLRTKEMSGFEANIKKINDDFALNQKGQSEEFKKNTNNLENEAKKTLEYLEKTKQEIIDIYKIVGDVSITGSQKEYANRAKNFANWLFWIAFLIMLFGASIIIVPIIKSVYSDSLNFDWKVILYRIPIALTLFVPAFYAANESKKQRDKENIYRDLEIKMCAIKPYFMDISNGKNANANDIIPEKDLVRLDLAKKLLSPNEFKNNDDNIVLPKEIVEIIKDFIRTCQVKK